MDFDTGSADLWVWSTELSSSIQQQAGSSHTIFDPTKSSTYKASSDSTWQIQYGDGSTASGIVGTDNVNAGGLVVQNQAIELANTLSAQFQQGPGDGLLGLAFVSTPDASLSNIADFRVRAASTPCSQKQSTLWWRT